MASSGVLGAGLAAPSRLMLSPRSRQHHPTAMSSTLARSGCFFSSSSSSSSSLKLAILFIAFVIYSSLVGLFLSVSLTRNERSDEQPAVGDAQRLLRLPIPLSNPDKDAIIRQQFLKQRKQQQSPTQSQEATTLEEKEKYLQLSPPFIIQKNNNYNTNDSADYAWSWPILHIVSTPFMQHQPRLIQLAKSRLKLLQVIALPSLLQQSIHNSTILVHDVYYNTKWKNELDTYYHQLQHRTAERRRIKGKVAGNDATIQEEKSIMIDPIFLWIIKIDPYLNDTILSELQSILEPVKHFTLIVGSNTNYGVGVKPGGWRGGEAGRDILNAYDNGKVYSPSSVTTKTMVRNMDELSSSSSSSYDYQRMKYMIHRAYNVRDQRVVLETRLDADDALNINYFSTLHQSAIRRLIDRRVSGKNNDDDYNDDDDDGDDDDDDTSNENSSLTTKTARWLYWCPATSVQWIPSSSETITSKNPGTLQVLQMPQTCITPGLTLGFAMGTREENVPRYTHDRIYYQIAILHNNSNTMTKPRDIHDCGLYPSSKCVILVDRPKVSAFRSRVMTSAGMHNIETHGVPGIKTDDHYVENTSRLWEHKIEENFGIQTHKVKEVVDYLAANYLATIQDNLKGQCTHGHSCKLSTMEKLQMTIDVLQEEKGGISIDSR